jgi:hypothetical protein
MNPNLHDEIAKVAYICIKRKAVRRGGNSCCLEPGTVHGQQLNRKDLK